MAVYTVQLKEVVDSITFNNIGITERERVKLARPVIFNFDYPIWNPEYKEVLELKILNHFLFREIGFETWGLFKYKLETMLNEIMPYFNQLYKTVEYEYTATAPEIEKYKYHSDDTAEASANGNASTLISDLPQTDFAGADYGTSKSDSQNSNGSTGKNTSNSEYEKTVVGNRAYSMNDLIKGYRDNLINIDMQIIGRLENLFMTLY